MSFLKGVFGSRKQQPSFTPHPRCSSCGSPIMLRLPDKFAVDIGPKLPFSGELPAGVDLFEGTECSACGKSYCLDCHDFGSKGPKCPGCGEWQLMPIMRKSP